METSKIKEIEESYIKEADWEVHENANTTVSYSDLLGFMMDKLLKNPEVLREYLPKDAVSMHYDGDIHIHKLPHSLWIPYCVGWAYPRILRLGLKTPSITSGPAKHLDTAISHLINFFYLASQEWTGAQATSAMDLYAAPFVRNDGLNYRSVKQGVQKMLFELNYPSRLGYQSAFTNVTILLDTVKGVLDGDAIIGGKTVGTLSDYLDEAITVAKALFELNLEGDYKGQQFTFPIVTLMLTPNFDWNGRRWGELTDLIFTALARRGTAYLLNGYTTNVESLYAMCCRLTLDVSKIPSPEPLKERAEEFKEALCAARFARGMWALPDATGSIGVVTINLPRLGYVSRGEWGRFEELLMDRLDVARRVLLWWRRRYEHSLESGLMPITKLYIGHLLNHYNTIGLVGLPEMASNFMRDPDLWRECERRSVDGAVSIMRRVVRTTRKMAEEFEEEDGCLYNVEEVPAESTAYRLATKDLKTLGEDAFIPMDGGTPYYSNSIVPYYADVPLTDRIRWEAEVQPEFTGGVMMHILLNESPDPDALKNLVRNIAKNTKVVYFSITPTIAICRKCGWNGVGLYSKCPKCGGDVDLWSRIVGYYRPVRNWNVGKKAEFKQRVHYNSRRLALS